MASDKLFFNMRIIFWKHLKNRNCKKWHHCWPRSYNFTLTQSYRYLYPFTRCEGLNQRKIPPPRNSNNILPTTLAKGLNLKGSCYISGHSDHISSYSFERCPTTSSPHTRTNRKADRQKVRQIQMNR